MRAKLEDLDVPAQRIAAVLKAHGRQVSASAIGNWRRANVSR